MSDSDSFTRFVSELWKVRALIVTTHATFRHKCRRNNNFRPQRMNSFFSFSSFLIARCCFYGLEIWDPIKQFKRNCRRDKQLFLLHGRKGEIYFILKNGGWGKLSNSGGRLYRDLRRRTFRSRSGEDLAFFSHANRISSYELK
jgi:hypothetical protein